MTNKEVDEVIDPGKAKKKINELVPEVADNKRTSDSDLIITEELMNRLSAPELFQLSDLQLELSTTNRNFARVFMVGRSLFLQKISP